MTNPDVTAIVQGYITAWSEPHEPVRRTLLEQVWTDAGIYTDPTVYGEGRDSLNRIIGDLHQRAPGSQFRLTSGVDVHHGFVRFAWNLMFANGTGIDGVDFGELAPDGRLQSIVGFF